MKMMISLRESRGALSYAICFDIPPHQLLYLTIVCTEDTHMKKKKRWQTGETVDAGARSNAEY